MGGPGNCSFVTASHYPMFDDVGKMQKGDSSCCLIILKRNSFDYHLSQLRFSLCSRATS